MITELAQNGYYHVSNVFAKTDIEPFDRETAFLIDQWYDGQIDHPDFWSYTNRANNTKFLYRIQNFERHCPSVLILIEKNDFKRLLNNVFDRDASANCFALVIRMPNSSGVPWHRDVDNILPNKLFNFSIFIDNSFPENGCLEVARETHLDYNDYSGVASSPEITTKLPASANDIIIHDVRLFHGSGTSYSNFKRRSIVIEFGKI